MIVIREGALTFSFSAPLQAQKYDEWSFYRNRFSKVKALTDGIKAVDIVTCNGTQAWLIEVKDYRVHQRTIAIDLADEVAKKIYDTLSGLVAAKFHADDSDEQSLASAILQSQTLRIVLHLEQPLKPSKLFPRAIDPSKVLQKLRQNIKAIDPHPSVLEKATTTGSLPWSVV